MEENANQFLGEERIGRLMRKYAIPCIVALLIVALLPRQLIGIFGAANESVYYTDFAVKAFWTYLCMMVFACVNKACFIFLQDGVLYSMPLSDLLTFVIAVVLIIQTYKQLSQITGKEPQPSDLN